MVLLGLLSCYVKKMWKYFKQEGREQTLPDSYFKETIWLSYGQSTVGQEWMQEIFWGMCTAVQGRGSVVFAGAGAGAWQINSQIWYMFRDKSSGFLVTVLEQERGRDVQTNLFPLSCPLLHLQDL